MQEKSVARSALVSAHGLKNEVCYTNISLLSMKLLKP